MVLAPVSLPFEIGDAQWMNDAGWPILALIGVLTLSLYLWSYIRKNYEIWKAHEGKYFDSEVLDTSRRMALTFIISLLAISAYIVVSLVLDLDSNPFWQDLTIGIFKLFTILIIFLTARLVVMVLNRVARKHRVDPVGGKMMPSWLEFSAILLSYVVYIGSIILVVLIAVSLVTNLDTLFIKIGEFLADKQSNIFVTIAIVVVIYIVIKVEEAILEDIKFRSKKFNPQVIDLIQVGIRYILAIICVLIVIFNLFMMVGMEDVGVLLVVVMLIFICLAIVMSYSTIQNVVSGLVLMDTSPFEVGDRIRIMEGMSCDVFEKGLLFTKVKTSNGEIVDVPNSKIIKDIITNFSRLPSHGIIVQFEVSYDISHERVESYVMEALEGIEGLLKDPRPELLALEVRGRNILYELLVFTKNVHQEPSLRSSILMNMQDVFHTEGHKTLVTE